MKALITFCLFLGALLPVQAQIIYLFDNDGTTIGSGLDGMTTGDFTVDGLTITVNSAPNTEEFNATASNFGINQAAAGDDTDAFDFEEADGPGVAEGLTVSFDSPVTLNEIDVSSWNAGTDEVEVTHATLGLIATVNSTGSTSLNDAEIPANELVTIMTTAGDYGNGWSLDSLTVTVVPEPEEYVFMLGLGLVGFVFYRRFKFRRS